MTALSRIGPIELSRPNQITRNPQNDNESRTIVIRCTPEEANQLKGLVESLNKSESGVKVVSCKNSRWGIMPVETPIRTESSFPNEATEVHKGLMAISKVEDTFFNQNLSEVTIEGEMITPNVNSILTQAHSFGGEGGSDIEMSETYSDLTQEVILTEPFTSFDTTNVWEAKYAENMAAGNNIASSGGKLVFSGASATNWTWGYLWTILRDTVPDEFTAEFTLEWDALPASGAAHHQINLYFVDGRPATKTELEYKDIIRVVIGVKSTGATLSVDKRVRGNYSNVTSDIALGSGEKTPAIKLELSGGSGVSNLTVYVDKDYSSGTPDYGNPVFGPANTGVNFDLDRYLVLSQENASSTSATTRIAYLNMYQYVDALKPNIVTLPVGAMADRTPDFYRTGEEGAIPCIKNPTSFPTFQVTPANYYKGTVRGLNTNYSDSVSRLITNNNFSLDPTKLTVTNGLIRLVPGLQSVTFQYYNGSSWVTLNTFTLPNAIQLIRPFLVTKDRFILQIDRTLWELKSGSYGIWVKHPTTPLGYTSKMSYYHDGVLQNGLAANADVSMLTQFYTLAFSPYNLLTTNQFGLESDLTGWSAVGSTTSRVTPGHGGSGYAIQFDTDNSAIYEGVDQTIRSVLPSAWRAGLILSTKGFLKGSVGGETVQFQVNERDGSGTTLVYALSPVFTLTPSFASYNYDYVIERHATEQVSMKILTSAKQDVIVAGDFFQIAPVPSSSSVPISVTPSLTNRYGMFITKTHPTTIKSDSIPASDLTGIGVYDQMQPSTADNGFLSLAREWFRPAWQKTILEGVI